MTVTVMDSAINISLDIFTTGELHPYQRSCMHPMLKDKTVERNASVVLNDGVL